MYIVIGKLFNPFLLVYITIIDNLTVFERKLKCQGLIRNKHSVKHKFSSVVKTLDKLTSNFAATM